MLSTRGQDKRIKSKDISCQMQVEASRKSLKVVLYPVNSLTQSSLHEQLMSVVLDTSPLRTETETRREGEEELQIISASSILTCAAPSNIPLSTETYRQQPLVPPETTGRANRPRSNRHFPGEQGSDGAEGHLCQSDTAAR